MGTITASLRASACSLAKIDRGLAGFREHYVDTRDGLWLAIRNDRIEVAIAFLRRNHSIAQETDRRSFAAQARCCPPAVLAKGSKSCHTRAVSDLFLIMPTAGEYRVVEAVVRTRRLPVALRMCGMGPRRAATLCAEFERGARPRGLALLGWAGWLGDDLAVGAGWLGDDLAVGAIVIADEALSAGRSDVKFLALPLACF